MFVVATKGTTKALVGRNETNTTELILTLQNFGELVDGMVNTNISKADQLNSVFKKIRKLKVKTTCNILDYSLFVVKICPKEQKDKENLDSPKGRYNSTVQVQK
jgi:hypothetical protein